MAEYNNISSYEDNELVEGTYVRACLQSKESNKVWLKNTRTISTNYPICHNEWQCVCYLLIV